MRKWLLVSMACWAFAGANIRAEIVPDLYTVNVPVADQSATELQRAASAGLREVAVRISGRSDTASQRALTSTFADAQRLLTQYRYEHVGDGWMAQFKFAPASVDRLLRGAEQPVWGADRPPITAWVVLQDGQSMRLMDAQAPLAAELLAQAQHRGVHVQIAGDGAGVSVDDIAQPDVAKLQAAARAGSVLLIAIVEQTANNFSGRWLLAANGQQISANNRSDTLSGFVAANFDYLIDYLSAQYAASADASEGVTLHVAGVASFDDYSALLNYLQRIALIKRVNPAWVRNDEMQLQLKLQGTPEQLARQIALENKLTLDSTASAADGLSYRWAGTK